MNVLTKLKHMKKIDFPSLAVAVIAGLFIVFCLASCSAVPEIPADGSGSGADDLHYQFQIEMVVSDAPVENLKVEATAYLDNLAYPDSAWTFTLSQLFCSAASDPAGKIQISNDGYFEFSSVIESFGGYVDTVTGSGYFDADTLYFSYSYVEAGGNSGVVSGHSL